MTKDQKLQWQRYVAYAIIDPSCTPAADKLRLLAEWPILRAWANASLKRNPDKVPAKTLDAYLRDALAWSGHLGDPAALIANGTPATSNGITTTPVNTKAGATCDNSTTVRTINGKHYDGKCEVKYNGKKLEQSNDEATRPTHYDQYRHVMPEELNQRFDTEITDLYLLRSDLATRRDNLADLVEQAMYAGEEKTEDEASAQLSDVAQQLVAVDATIRAFWALVDVAFHYYELNGEIMPIKDLREQAPVPVDSSAGKRQRAPRTPDHTKAEIEAMDEGACREAAKAERIRKNAQFLRDKRKADTARANGGEAYEKWRAQIVLRAKEMEEWGESLTAVQQDIVASATRNE